MDKSIHTDEYAVLVELLKESREAAELTQEELAKKLKQSQSFVSKMETGDRRLDLVQLRTVCAALGVTLADFVAQFEGRLVLRSSQSSPPSGAEKQRSTPRKRRGRTRSRR
jgi:transcriptional regulator with XRE-family HTH domain